MIRRLGICFLILFSSMRCMAISATVAHTLFYSNKAGTLTPSVELSWQIIPRTIRYKTTPENKIIGKVRTDVVFMNDTGVILQNHFILQTAPKNNADELTTLNIQDLRHYPVTPGFIRMKFTLTDIADSTNRYTYTDSFMVPPDNSSAFFSQLQLLDTVLNIQAQTIFTKNGRQQIPGSSNFLDDYKTNIHYYAELYQTNKVPKIDYPLVQKVFISKKENDYHYGNYIKMDTIRNPSELALVSGDFSLAALPSGNYYLCASLENNTQKIISRSSIFIQRLNTHPAPEEVVKKAAAIDTGIESVTFLNLDKTFLAKYDLAHIRAILKMLLPVSDAMGVAAINNFLKKPDEMYMRYYIYNYFLSVDKKEPGRAWKEYADKVKHVNQVFTSHGTPGYESERGFIYLRYGPPTDVITVPNEGGSLPYEIWQYNSLTQLNHKDIPDAVFLFYKPNEITSDFRLLHSNVAGEVQNPGWRSYLYTNGSGGNDGNARAEEYIGKK